MKLSEIPQEDLELMSYDEIALLLLQENGKKMKLQDIVKKVAKLLGLSDNALDDEMMEFFEKMSINKKFIMLKNGFWDLQSRHKLDVVIEDEEEDEEETTEEADVDGEEVVEDEESEDVFYNDEGEDETEDVVDDDLADFTVVDGDNEEM